VSRPVIAFCILSASLCMFVSQSPGQVSQNASRVEIKEVRPLKTTGGTQLQQVTVSLDFPGWSSIYVDGYGEVPSKTALTYVTDGSRLTIRASSGKPPLTDQMLSATAISMGADLDPVPRDSYKYFGGNGPAPTTHFRVAQAGVLSQRFLFPPYVYTHNSNTFSETRYHRLTVDERNLIVEVAAQLSFPSDSATNAGFELRYAVRERRKGTDWLPEPSSSGAQAASSFIVDLIQELTRNE